MKASIFMAAALASAGTPASARSVIGTVPAHGGRRVAISPQLPDGSLSTAEKDALTFDVLSDIACLDVDCRKRLDPEAMVAGLRFAGA
jgi:hypothetical protein